MNCCVYLAPVLTISPIVPPCFSIRSFPVKIFTGCIVSASLLYIGVETMRVSSGIACSAVAGQAIVSKVKGKHNFDTTVEILNDYVMLLD